jgi:hypothetical protein
MDCEERTIIAKMCGDLFDERLLFTVCRSVTVIYYSIAMRLPLRILLVLWLWPSRLLLVVTG